MYTDYPSGASMQQPQSPPMRADLRSQSPKDMSNEQLALWLRNHPSLSGTDYEEDISKLRGAQQYIIIMLVVLYHDHNIILFRCQN